MGLRSRVPESVKALARPVAWRMSDAAAKTRGTLKPPQRLISQVPGDFVAVGREFVAHFRDLGHLRPDHRVLDIGCGPGRMAIPLTTYLSRQGSYEGIDTWLEAVEWCSKNITPRFGNFGFRPIKEVGSGEIVIFPYEQASFDFASLGAISQLDKNTFLSYVNEASRLLRAGGTYFGTCLLTGDNPDEQEQPLTADRFYFREKEFRDTFASLGLDVQQIYRGSWNGHPNPLSYQDIVVATKVVRPI
jgi:SAM-dependent methyltransferase